MDHLEKAAFDTCKEKTFAIFSSFLGMKRLTAVQIEQLEKIKSSDPLLTKVYDALRKESEKINAAINSEVLEHIGTIMAKIHTKENLENFVDKLTALQEKS